MTGSVMKEKIIGVLGGMGPEATLTLFNEIIRQSPANKDQDHLRVIIYNNPKIPDRTAAILNDGEDPLPEMENSCHALEKAGAAFIVMPCVSAHFFLHRLQEKVSLPILSIYEAVGLYIQQQYCQVLRVGLLATSGTVVSGLFQVRLKEKRISTLIPRNGSQEKVMDAIYTIKGNSAGEKRDVSKQRLLEAANDLIDQGAQGIIAGCTEIPLVLREQDLVVPLFNPLKILADAAIRKAKDI